jgi:NAD(P)-dependent dehydrogenase (short-subunit alcohol dehydrogenase family)
MPRPSRTFDRLAGKAAIVTSAGSPKGGISAGAAGGVDILVNNVGISSSNPLVGIDFAAWSRVFDINLRTAVAMSSFAVPKCRRAAAVRL